ncbi:malectin domain-containing carbohydrate-binding protein [Cyclobacterium sp.]|uniref:malectin domain-containing carbohydrate-binding protein n=1 Tax=Cyclobacterium sp. TaxID=1966343 RepID=UPI0025BDF036|nr:malectin domain-containing carbohydrate-binding protein [Cyclobacterium sp.]
MKTEMNKTANDCTATRMGLKKGVLGCAFLLFFTTMSIGSNINKVNKFNYGINHSFFYLNQDTVPTNVLGEKLWSAGHENGTQEEWFQNGGGGEFNSSSGNSSVSSEAARSGSHSLKMSINTTNGGSHGTRNYRWSEIADHKDLIFTQYFYFPNRIDFDRNNNWFNLIQTKGVKFAPGGAGTGPDQINHPHFVLGLDVRGGAGSGGANFLSLADLQKFWGSNPDVIWKAPAGIDLPVRKWVKIQMRIIQDRGDKGRILVWQDDILIIDTKFRNTLRPEVDQNMFSINAYADKTYPNLTNIYIDDLSIHLPGTPNVEKEPVPLVEPEVSIIEPQNEFTITEGETVKIETEVSTDPSLEIAQVEFFSNGSLLGASDAVPHDYTLSNLSEGTYQVKAKVWDSQGSVNESEEIRLIVLAKEEEITEEPEVAPDEITQLPSGPGFNYSFGSNENVIFKEAEFMSDPGSEIIFGTSYTFRNINASGTKLYQQERNSPDLRLKVPLDNGIYTVVTYHNELWFGKNGPSAIAGRRVFSIQLEEELLKENFDLFRENNNEPTQLIFENIEVVDGYLDIRMLATKNRATLSGLSIFPQEGQNGKPGLVKNDFQMALNTGAGESTVFGNNEFEAEIGSFDFFNSTTIYAEVNASKDVLFQTERHGLNLIYKIPVPNGTYEVKTYHNELWYGKRGPRASAGNRVFSISLEGKVVKNNLDLFLENNNQPLELVFEEVEVNDGILELKLQASANRATISGLAISGKISSTSSNLRMGQTEFNSGQLNEGINSKESEVLISLYPNPAVDQIYLEGDAENFQQFLIHDSLGNLLFQFDPLNLQRENDRYLIPLNGFKEGIYLISVMKKDNSVERLRFMILS